MSRGFSSQTSIDRLLNFAVQKHRADKGEAKGQFIVGLFVGTVRVSIDAKRARHYFKLSANQGNADSQCNYGVYPHNGDDVLTDFNKGNAVGQCHSGNGLENGKRICIDLRNAAYYFQL
jgi:hypothetical protein